MTEQSTKFRVICALPNASENISGVKFSRMDDGRMLSEEIEKEVAERFARITGYSIYTEETNPPSEPEKAQREAAEKAAQEAAEAEAAEKAAQEAAEKEAAEKAAAEAAEKAEAEKAAAEQEAAEKAAKEAAEKEAAEKAAAKKQANKRGNGGSNKPKPSNEVVF